MRVASSFESAPCAAVGSINPEEVMAPAHARLALRNDLRDSVFIVYLQAAFCGIWTLCLAYNEKKRAGKQEDSDKG